MSRAVEISPHGWQRVAVAAEWLRARDRAAPLLVVAPSLATANELVRNALGDSCAAFGWYRESVASLAGRLAAVPMATNGLVPVSALSLEALCVRVVSEAQRDGDLGRFERVADRPGLPRAIARTLRELALAGLEPGEVLCDPDLQRVYARFRHALSEGRFADRATVVRDAAEAVSAQRFDLSCIGVPTLFLDVPAGSKLEQEFIARLAERAPTCLATVPAGDARAQGFWRRALGTPADRSPANAVPARPGALARLQAYLFEARAEPGELGDEVVVLSAPGEGRECVEITRRVVAEVEAGTRLDDMAILLREPAHYRTHLVSALRRAGIPAYFSRGTTRPEPAGRALLALLACAAESLSARRFAEYLSLGVVPRPAADGAPPRAAERAQRWAAPDDEAARLPVRDDVDAATADSGDNVGVVRTPRRWEKLIVNAAVIGGRDRWERRLGGLERALEMGLRECAAEDDPKASRLERDLQALRDLRAFALPLIDELSRPPFFGGAATWRHWLDALSALATRAIAEPTPVLRLLAELEPMGSVGPVDLAEVRSVLEPRLGELVERPTNARAGRLFVGSIAESRGMTFDVVFVPGLAEKLFPRKVSEDPLLLDALRRQLSADLETQDDRIAAERLALQIAVGAARRRVVLSYPRFETERARPRVPSFYGLEVLRAAEGVLPGFDQLARRAAEVAGARMGWPAPGNPTQAIDAAEYDLAVLGSLLGSVGYARAGTTPETVKGAARYLVSSNEWLARALRGRGRRWHRGWHREDGLVDPSGLARGLLAQYQFRNRTYSVTALEKYAACPYRFFLSAMVGLAPRETADALEEIDPLTRGLLVHDILRAFLSEMRQSGELPVSGSAHDVAIARLDRVIDEVVARYRDDLAPAIARVWEDGIADIRSGLREWLLRAEEDPAWISEHFELGFGLRHSDSDPASRVEPVVLDSGLRLRGSIDVVERRGNVLRATDYKTGTAKQVSTSIIGGGTFLQPALYALVLEKLFELPVEGGRAYYCTPAGGFAEVAVPLEDDSRASVNRLAETIGNAVEIGFLPAAPAEGACDVCDYSVVCGPYEALRVRRKRDTGRLEPLVQLRKER